jgi:glycosyltransferase involved in cell wall biosynthesis
MHGGLIRNSCKARTIVFTGERDKSGHAKVSVIIASYNARKTIGECLASLHKQATEAEFEIIVVDSSTDGTADLVRRIFPQVRVFYFAERKFCGDARNFGVSVARGEIVAFIDADCTADPGWVGAIRTAHRSPDPAIGGAIANGNPESHIGWAAYFCEFSQWMPNVPPQRMTDIACANMSYKKGLFEKFGRFIEGTYCSDTEFHWRLGREGYSLRFEPLIEIAHHNIDNFGKFLRHEYQHGRFFAQVRTRSQGFSMGRRYAYVLLSPFIPIKLIWGISARVLANSIYLAAFLKSIPLLVLGIFAWSLGECRGYAETRKFGP